MVAQLHHTGGCVPSTNRDGVPYIFFFFNLKAGTCMHAGIYGCICIKLFISHRTYDSLRKRAVGGSGGQWGSAYHHSVHD